MNGLEELKKKLSDIEIQNLAMEGCGPTFTVSDIMDLIYSIESAHMSNRKVIYLDDAIDAIYKCTDIYVGNLPIMVDKSDAYKALEALPSAQPEIISCNQCVYYQQNHHYCEFLDTEFSPSDFCSQAERREE